MSSIYTTNNLSLQFAFPSAEPIPGGKKLPKVRNKKIKEKPEYDILQIDEQIKACFVEEKKKIPEYKKRIESMAKTIANLTIPFGVSHEILEDISRTIGMYKTQDNSPDIKPVMTYREFLSFYDQFKRLIMKKNNIANNSLYDKYICITQDIIEEYRHILSIPIKTIFLSKTKPKSENGVRKSLLLDNYLKIASNFIDIEYIPDSPKQVEKKYVCKCGNCTEFETKEGLMTCEQCGRETDIISVNSSFKDQERINLHQKYRYEKKSHFREGVYQYQGKQNKSIDRSVFIKADQWLDIHNLLNLEVPEENKKERYAKVTKDHLRMFLSESEDQNLTKHYEDLHLIYSKLTGNPCADISYLEEKLYAQFDKLVEAFLSMGDEIDRTNILNSSFVLRKLLLMNNYVPDPQDFPGLKTVTRMHEHEDLFVMLCQRAGLNDPDTMSGIKDIPKTTHDGFL